MKVKFKPLTYFCQAGKWVGVCMLEMGAEMFIVI
jgi:hypothetical protein